MIRRAWILGACLALLPAVSQAALVLLVEGVPGPSTIKDHSGWFNLGSATWGIDRSNGADRQGQLELQDQHSVVSRRNP